MELRSTWKFHVSVATALKGAQERYSHHEQRLQFWTEELIKCEDELKDKGIQWQLGGLTRANMSANFAAQPMFDQNRLKTVQEAQSHVDKHKTAIQEFRSWMTAFGFLPESHILEMTIGDILFFGLTQEHVV